MEMESKVDIACFQHLSQGLLPYSPPCCTPCLHFHFFPCLHFQLIIQFAFRITALNSNLPHQWCFSTIPLGRSGHSSAGHQRRTKLWLQPNPSTSSPSILLPLYAPTYLQFSTNSGYFMPSCLPTGHASF